MTDNEKHIINLRVKIHAIESAIEIVRSPEHKDYDYNGTECVWGLRCVLSELNDWLAKAIYHNNDQLQNTNPEA